MTKPDTPRTLRFYIDGRWIDARARPRTQLINPVDERITGELSLATAEDVDRAVNAARRAFDDFFSGADTHLRRQLLERLLEAYRDHKLEMGELISQELGAPQAFAQGEQADCGDGHIEAALRALQSYRFSERCASGVIVKEPVGVCGLITPWNWPINQIACKLAPALACGCTCVLKASEYAPQSAALFAEVFDQAARSLELPGGIFNLLQGTGAEAGQALAGHRQVDMVSFTGSTRAGIAVAEAAATDVKRVAQELGGKSAYIVCADADLNAAVSHCCEQLFLNSGQSCNAPSRLLVPAKQATQAAELARQYAASIRLGAPTEAGVTMGPVINAAQFERVQRLIQAGIDEGARLVCGGLGRPAGLNRGYYVQPTVFADVDNAMRIAREEIFGPVLCIIPYQFAEQAIDIANDSPYGLAAYVYTAEPAEALKIAAKLRVGMVHINGAECDFDLPFGGYKQSGNGREWGSVGFEDYLETKAIMGI